MPLTHPEYFTILAPDGRAFRGAVQDWYPTAWQRRAGCGPTTAAVLLSYLARTHPALASLGPQGDPETTAGFLPYMEELWRYATPGPQGLKEAEHLTLACRSFALSRGCRLREAILPIPRAGQGARPTPAQCRSFLEDALGRDCPVAFLNYDEGDVTELGRSLCVRVRFRGSHLQSPEQYARLLAYTEAHGLTPAGFSREITLVDYGLTSDPEKFVTEITIPVRPAG